MDSVLFMVSFAMEELHERNETVMKEMRLDMTFEERLIAGKKPLVESDEEESEEDKDKENAEEGADNGNDAATSGDKENETFDDIMREAQKNISASES